MQHLESSRRNILAQWLSQLPADVLGARSLRPVQHWLSDVAHQQQSPGSQVCAASVLYATIRHTIEQPHTQTYLELHVAK